MSTLAISRRYARAVFELIQEGAALSEGLADLASVASMQEVHRVLVSPGISAATKAGILDKACGGLSAELGRLVTLLASRNKVQLLPEINGMVEQLVLDSQSEVVASITSATALSSATQTQISTALSNKSGRKVRLETALDDSLLGGMVVRIGDRQIDYSLRTRLESMRKTIAG
ncbi:MAG: F0F1 ATP synthase subunit delta [Mariprofundus sp.]